MREPLHAREGLSPAPSPRLLHGTGSVVFLVQKNTSATHWHKPSWLPRVPRCEGESNQPCTFATIWSQTPLIRLAEHIFAQPCFCSFKALCMLGILLPWHWNTVVRESYLPWIMYWMPRNMNSPMAGNLVCFKQTQLPNPFFFKLFFFFFYKTFWI